MPTITFIEPDGIQRAIAVRAGVSLMEAAVRNGVAGIAADCGGACACATCHVYIDPGWIDSIPPRREMEEEMIEFALDLRDNSRLSCQILVTDALDGMVVGVPPG